MDVENDYGNQGQNRSKVRDGLVSRESGELLTEADVKAIIKHVHGA